MSGTHLSERDALRTMLRRAAVVAAADGGTQQLLDLTGLAGEALKKVVHVQPFGFSSVPPAGAEGLILCLGGRSDRAMFVGGEHKQHRPTGVAPGGTTIYDAFGQAISLVKNSIRIVGSQTITIQAPVIVLDGAVQITGDVTGDGGGTIDIGATINQTAGNFVTVGNVTAGPIDLRNHIHPVSGGSTGAPTG